MEKQKKKIAEAPDGMEYIWVIVPGLAIRSSDGGIIRPNKIDATEYQFDELKMVRTEKLYTYEGRRCIFADLPVFEVEKL